MLTEDDDEKEDDKGRRLISNPTEEAFFEHLKNTCSSYYTEKRYNYFNGS